MTLRQRGYLTEGKMIDTVLKELRKASYGDKLIFSGETGAATGAGREVKRVFYFVMIRDDSFYTSSKKPSHPGKPVMDITHKYKSNHRMGLGAILPFRKSSSRPNAMTLGFIDDVEVVK